VEASPAARSIVIAVHVPVAPNGPLVCDVSQITEPDLFALDVLACLQLTARRLGVSIRLHNAGAGLVDLLVLAGLSDVLVVGGSGVESDREVEEREEVGVDEEVHRRDGAG
jgi:STAS domain